MSQTQCELLTLSLQDLERMRCEFSEAYNVLFLGLYERLKNSHKIKVYAISHCNNHLVDIPDEEDEKEDRRPDNSRMRFSLQKLPDDFKIQPVDLREIDEGGSMFQSSLSSDSLEEEASLSDSGQNEDAADSDKDKKKKRDNSIDIIQERDSEYTQKDQTPANKSGSKKDIKAAQKTPPKAKITSAQKRMDRIFNRKEDELNIKRNSTAKDANAFSEDDKSAENILHRLHTLRSGSLKTG